MSIDARSRLVQAFNDFGGRVSGEQILKFIKDDELLNRETRYSIKKLITSIAVVEYDSDKKRYLVLKDLARDKENLACNMCQSTQTTTSQSSENQNVPKSTVLSHQGSQSTKSLVPTTAITTPATSINVAAVRPSVYSTFTSNETRLWWMAVIDCRVADMKRLLGINPKLANWADPVNGWTALHYAAKFGKINCLKLLINQYHVNVNTRSRNGRTPLHIAVVHSQHVVIRALVDDFKADPALMDFSGYFPYMLLENNLKTEYEPFLTHGRLQRIRTALKVFRTSNVSHDSSNISKDNSSKKGVVHTDHSMVDFKRPVMLPVVSRRLENFKRPTTILQQNHLNRTSTLKPINQNAEYSLRRPSVFEGILKSAAEAAQHWNHHNNNCNNDHTSSVKLSSESNEEQVNNDNTNVSKPLNTCSSSTTTTESTTTITDPHKRLVQRLDSMISLRREQNALSNFSNSNHSNEIGSSFDLSTSLDNNDYFSTINYRKANTLDRRFPPSMGSHNLKHSSQSTDPYTLKLLLSLLPSIPPSTSSVSSSSLSSLGLKNINGIDDNKLKKLTSLSSFHKHLNKKLHRSLSSSSTVTSFKTTTTTTIHSKHHSYHHHNNNNDTLHEFHSLPHRHHSSNMETDKQIINDYHHKSISTTALLAETDVCQLITSKVNHIIKRKASSVSQH
ncbi:unnamed protein product [Schistosoma haematobium]|nr:unnamed protein product [Schistosoma haematobium]